MRMIGWRIEGEPTALSDERIEVLGAQSVVWC